jgi:DNA mismatch repair protein MutS2
VDDHSLRLLEFDRVTATMAARAATARGAALLSGWRPIAERAALLAESGLLREAIRRQTEPGEWCHAAPGEPGARLAADASGALDGPGLVEVLGWLEAARATRTAWDDAGAGERFPALAALVLGMPVLEALRASLARALEPDGRLADGASPALARLRRGVAEGERALEEKLGRWARQYGAESYVTRHADRFVALVPAAGFPRRRGIVHDVSGSGQSLFVEPLEACEANNHLIELRSGVAAEEARLLQELAGRVIDVREEFLGIETGLVHLDTLRARARWAAEVGAIAVEPAPPCTSAAARGRLRLRAARHPLLALGERRASLVPLDLDLEPPGTLLLVSGPNMGGKTVLLKTVGLAVLLAHAALPVPAAEGSAVPWIGRVIADLGDEQSVDQGLSTFAAHLKRLRLMAEQASSDTLLLCDELGAGTDPEEGGSLGRALLEHFAARGSWGVVTTHLGSLKRVAGEVVEVVNGSLDFDRERMRPRYRFLPGVPGASHALAVAEQLGLPAEIVARARALTPRETLALERLLEELQGALRRADDEAAELRRARGEAESAAAEHRVAIEEARRTVDELRRRLTRESEVVLGHARELWQTVQREARRAEKTRASAETVRARLETVEGEADTLRRAADQSLAGFGGPAAPAAGAPARLEVGERVRDRDLGVEAELVSGPDAEGRVMLRRGSWNIRSHVSRIEAAAVRDAQAPEARPRGPSATWEAPEAPQGLEVDLRGMEADEALASLDQALDRAVMGAFSELRIVHGIGRGILRAVVERHLRGHPQVASQRLGEAGEGGRGATVVRLR